MSAKSDRLRTAAGKLRSGATHPAVLDAAALLDTVALSIDMRKSNLDVDEVADRLARRLLGES